MRSIFKFKTPFSEFVHDNHLKKRCRFRFSYLPIKRGLTCIPHFQNGFVLSTKSLSIYAYFKVVSFTE